LIGPKRARDGAKFSLSLCSRPFSRSRRARRNHNSLVFFCTFREQGALARAEQTTALKMGRQAPLFLLTIACALASATHADERTHRVRELEGEERAKVGLMPLFDHRSPSGPLNLQPRQQQQKNVLYSTSAATPSASGSTRSGPTTTRSRPTTTILCLSAARRRRAPPGQAAKGAAARSRRGSGAGSARCSRATA